MAQPELDRLKAELIEAIAAARDLAQLDEVRVKALGKKGRVSELMQTLGAMPPEKRKSFGQAVNALKTSVSEALDARHQVLAGAALVEKLASDRADISLPVREGPLAEGRIHPVSQVTDEIRIGEGDQWLEILGCGMVHPNVLKNVGIDPTRYQGFAFGLGIDRIAMLKYGMPDLRAFFSADLRWLKHYGFAPLAIPTLAAGLS